MKNYKGVENDIYRLSENVKIKRNNVEYESNIISWGVSTIVGMTIGAIATIITTAFNAHLDCRFWCYVQVHLHLLC